MKLFGELISKQGMSGTKSCLHAVLLIVRNCFKTDHRYLTSMTALQTGDKYRITTPVNWQKGDDVIVHPTVTNDEAKTLFPQHEKHLVSLQTDMPLWLL